MEGGNFFLIQQISEKNSDIYEIYSLPTIVKSCLNLTIGHVTILQYQFEHIINGFRNNSW